MHRILAGLGCLLPLALPPSAPCASLTVDAGPHDRVLTIVSLPLPKDAPVVTWMSGPDRELIQAQQDAEGTLTFVLPKLNRGTMRTYTILDQPASTPAGPAVEAAYEDSQVRFGPVSPAPLTFQAEPSALPRPGIDPIYRRGAYLHPIRTPAGRVVSDDYPHKHLHHHGLWFAWTKTEFQGRHPDFWNMGQKLGTVAFDAVVDDWSGSVHAGFRSRQQYLDLTAKEPTAALNETWDVRYYAGSLLQDRHRVFDIVVRQSCATSDPLILPNYHYGGLGFRGRGEWDGPPNCDFLTSEGETNRVKAHATRGRWCYIGGKVDGHQAGVVILCHPGNFRAPQPMRVHPSEPFFCFAPQQLGEMRIEPRQPYVSRYRCVAVDGPASREHFESLYLDYAQPPKVTYTP